MVEITIQVSDEMAAQLLPVKERMPEILAHGLDELAPLPNQVYQYILEFMVNQPSAEEVLNFGPSPEMQRRASALLEKNRAGKLTSSESRELDEYVRINHLVTMLKARAYNYLQRPS